MIHQYREGLRRAACLSVSLLSFVLSVLCSSCSRATVAYTDFAACGLSLPIDTSYVDKGLYIRSLGSGEADYPALFVYFQYLPALEALNAEMEAIKDGEMTQDLFDDFMEKAMQHYRQLAVAYAVPKTEYEDSVRDGGMDGKPYAGMRRIGSHNDRVYLARYGRTEGSTDGMEAEEKSLYEECVKEVERAFRRAKFIDLEEEAVPAGVQMPSSIPTFQSCDVKGTVVSNEIFSKADLTVVNVWGTFCGPCIKELPDLAEWDASLPSGVQLLGLVCDVNSPDDKVGMQDAQAILDKAGVRFTNILASDDWQVFLSSIQFVPTTFLVDKTGAVVGAPVVGADVRKYKKAVNDYLSKR
ncbi:MAG: TlpA family protein disulfide reductase [Treponema sp.]|nr:TlpA family protein disulfide reductase [Treponema sp.]